MQSKKINLSAILLESFFLVLGVLLALTANNWRENRKMEKRIKVVQESIFNELYSNSVLTAEAIGYHGKLLDTLYVFMHNNQQDQEALPPMDMFRGGFVQPAIFQASAWESAVSTGALEHIPYSEVLGISDVYLSQKQYDRQAQQVGAQINSKMFLEGLVGMQKNYKNMLPIIYTLIFQECGLMTSYEALLPRLNKLEYSRADSLQGSDFVVHMPKQCDFISQIASGEINY